MRAGLFSRKCEVQAKKSTWFSGKDYGIMPQIHVLPKAWGEKRWTSSYLTLTTSELGIYFEQITKSPSMISGQWRTLLGYESSCPGRCVQNTWNEMPLSLCWPLKKLDDCFGPQAHICGGYTGKIQLSLQSFQQICLPLHHIREPIRNSSTKFGLEKTELI